MSFIAIRENKIFAKISEFTVYFFFYTFVVDIEQNPFSKRGLNVHSLFHIKIKAV